MWGTITFWSFFIVAVLCLSTLLSCSVYPTLKRLGAMIGHKDNNVHHPKHYAIIGVSLCAVPFFLVGVVVIYCTFSYTVETTGLKSQYKIETNPSVASEIIVASLKTKTFS